MGARDIGDILAYWSGKNKAEQAEAEKRKRKVGGRHG